MRNCVQKLIPWSVLLLCSFLAHAGGFQELIGLKLPNKKQDFVELPCPISLKEWDQYLLKAAVVANQSLSQPDIPDRLVQCQKRLENSLSTGENSQLQACLEPLLVKFQTIDENFWRTPNDYSMATVPPPFDSEEFATLVNNPETQAKAIALIDKVNSTRPMESKIIYASFTAIIPAINGGGKGRFIIYVPGNPKKYIAYSVTGANRPANNISVVGVFRDSNGIEKPNFADHTMPEGFTVRGHPLELAKDVDCNVCHSGRPLQIFDPKSKDQTAIELINKSIREGNYAKFPIAYLGPERKRSDTFLNKCLGSNANFNSFDEKEAARDMLREHMSCVRCHSGAPGLQRPISSAEIFSNPNYFHEHIDSGNMPRNMKLPARPESVGDASAREALFRCLSLEAVSPDPDSNFLGVIGEQFRPAQSCNTAAKIQQQVPLPITPQTDGR